MARWWRAEQSLGERSGRPSESKPVDEAAKHEAGPMRVLAHALRRLLQDHGHLLDRQLNEVAQDEGSAGAIVDAFERLTQQPGDPDLLRRAAVELGPAALGFDETACAVEGGQQVLKRAPRIAAVGLSVRQRGLHRDSVQPRLEAVARRKRAQLAPGGEEGLL